MLKRILLGILLIAVITGGSLAYKYYQWVNAPNTPAVIEDPFLYIDKGTDVVALTMNLEQKALITDARSFSWVAKRMKFSDASVKTGRFEIEPGMSNYDLIQKLRLGIQSPVQLVIRSAWRMQELAGKISGQLLLDSTDLIRYIDSALIPSSDYTNETVMSLFIPNTYEVYWDISSEGLIQRMKKEHTAFWTERRTVAAAELGLTTAEVYTLASIVERETQAADERPAIAGVYLNRIERGIPLQADPTVLFALGDYTIRRVLRKHLLVESPYNTYQNQGLPPGPIWMPSISSIDAVLFPEEHDYLFFCAKPEMVGRHAFAETLSGHLRNARAYQQWLNREGIR